MCLLLHCELPTDVEVTEMAMVTTMITTIKRAGAMQTEHAITFHRLYHGLVELSLWIIGVDSSIAAATIQVASFVSHAHTNCKL